METKYLTIFTIFCVTVCLLCRSAESSPVGANNEVQHAIKVEINSDGAAKSVQSKIQRKGRYYMGYPGYGVGGATASASASASATSGGMGYGGYPMYGGYPYGK